MVTILGIAPRLLLLGLTPAALTTGIRLHGVVLLLLKQYEHESSYCCLEVQPPRDGKGLST